MKWSFKDRKCWDRFFIIFEFGFVFFVGKFNGCFDFIDSFNIIFWNDKRDVVFWCVFVDGFRFIGI